MHVPSFWKEPTKISTLLLPAAAVYSFFAAYARAGSGVRAGVPVICVGNAVVGGSGKTPVALALGEMLKAQGRHPHYLTRGYKGRLAGPVRVDPSRHGAADVGDEPLLLAEVLPTWVSRDRPAGAKAAVAAGADMILMDDGFQNPSLIKDISLLVIDGAYGFGNGRLLPAGPLREPARGAIGRAGAVVFIGEDHHNILPTLPQGKPTLRAKIVPLADNEPLAGVPVLAFAGIARPRKFYRTLHGLGAEVRHMMGYPDHHAYTPRDLASLRDKAKALGAKLVTTAKDYARLPADMRAEVISVRVEAVFDDPQALLGVLL
jgi:tetraacyldisaccharide 4'-kinase